MSFISLHEVSRLYGLGDATTVALEEVSLEVSSNEFIAIMGPSGSGKTSLLNIIGLLDRPSHGKYTLHGRDVSRMRAGRLAKLRRDKIGFVFQSYNLLPRLNVLENVALPLAYKGMPQTRRLKKASAMLEQVGLGDREYFFPAQLSGGQSQRAAIARALVAEPDVIIADEPTGNLDSASSLVVMELLGHLHQMGHTILMVTHNPELTRYANRVIFMQDGLVVADRPSKIGRVPNMARKTMYSLPKKTDEDDLAGVSALMNAIPAIADAAKRVAGSGKAAKKKSKQPKPKNYTVRDQKGHGK
jgi:putative ABC transport system ATP-binding protein